MLRPLLLAIYPLTLASVLATAPAFAQTARPSGPAASELQDGWTAFAAGRWAEAAAAAGRALAAEPDSHDAISLRVAALARTKTSAALDAYEQWLSGARVEDGFLLRPIAIGTAWELLSSRDPAVRAGALDLIRKYDAPNFARAASALPSTDDVAASAVLAAGGNAAAARRLQQQIDLPGAQDKTAVLALLVKSRGREAAPTVRRFLQDPFAPNRAEAARLAGELGDSSAQDTLKQLLQSDPVPLVRFSAAVALSELGDPAADPVVEQMTASPAPDVRLMAATALAARKDAAWRGAADGLLASDDPLIRVRAAELVLREDPADERAKAVLSSVLGSDNPVVQEAAASSAATTAHGDLALLRRLVRSPAALVRLRASESLLLWPGQQ